MVKTSPAAVLEAIRQLVAAGRERVSSTEVITATQGSSATVRRHLDALCASGELIRTGQARATRYTLARPAPATESSATLHAVPALLDAAAAAYPEWSPASLRLRDYLLLPLGARHPVTYLRSFVDDYVPNESALMPSALADELYRTGRLAGRQPAATFARKVLEQLLVDLSWSSSRLEGNRYSLLATRELFARGEEGTDADAVMLLNHKSAIEFLVDAVPTQGMTLFLIRNLHAVLMLDLLDDANALGAIRNKVVNITNTVYVPTQMPSLLDEMLRHIIEKARQIKNPVEAAFFLWVNIAYLQPFEDGNKRTSRLSANIPLMLYNCAPLSFLDVEEKDYAQAMLGIYECRDVSMAVDLFSWTYRRSMKKYAVVMESLGVPDPRRVRYRQLLTDAVGRVVREGKSVEAALLELQLTEEGAPGLKAMLIDDLGKLEVFNCARYRLSMPATQAWIDAGRPM
ncbi:Fic family protein [Cupriavidus agavae]|uniref:Fic/DOC family protein n=1 Tax=Cupriavidus agavae TaxID=1001822 RepID=A0A4Q7RBY2_9BURK|nr:Fic family protein [Cupriavidus agavae]RZT29112.1 Fic/DOC family protein [Cupriavidus agavae]